MHRDVTWQSMPLEKVKRKKLFSSQKAICSSDFQRAVNSKHRLWAYAGGKLTDWGVNPALCSPSAQSWGAELGQSHHHSSLRVLLWAGGSYSFLSCHVSRERRGSRVTRSCLWVMASPGARQLSHFCGSRLSSTHSRGLTQDMVCIQSRLGSSERSPCQMKMCIEQGSILQMVSKWIMA